MQMYKILIDSKDLFLSSLYFALNVVRHFFENNTKKVTFVSKIYMQ